MIREAQAHAAEDAKRREEAELLNRAETMIYQTEKTLKDLGDKVPGDVKNQVQTALTNLTEAKESRDIERIKSRLEALEQAAYKMSEAAYQSASAGDAGAAGAAGGPSENGHAGEGSTPHDEDVIEAEYKTE